MCSLLDGWYIGKKGRGRKFWWHFWEGDREDECWRKKVGNYLPIYPPPPCFPLHLLLPANASPPSYVLLAGHSPQCVVSQRASKE